MNIVCSPDTNYIRHCAVMLRSLYEANPDELIRVYIIHAQVDAQERAKLASYLGTFLDSVSFLQIDSDFLNSLPLSRHLTVAAYYRLLLPEILPSNIEKVLYLDCDVLVADSLHDLWHTALDRHPLAAVIDRFQEEHCQRLRLCGEASYFNSGVLLINLAAWRDRDIIQAGVDFALKLGEILDFHDQDILNYLFQCEWLHLSAKWNALPHLWSINCFPGEADYDMIQKEKESMRNPAIVHFAGSGASKPWNYHCIHPWRSRYLELKNSTPWASIPLEEAPPPWPVRIWKQSIFSLKVSARAAINKCSSLLGSN